MSRIGQQPITIPESVTVDIKPDFIEVSGQKGSLRQFQMEGIKLKKEDESLVVERTNDQKRTRGWHGLMRSLVANMITGVSQGFEKRLELVGIGYRVNLEGNELVFQIGFSHQVNYSIPEGIEAEVLKNNVIVIKGISKQQVGQVAAEIRSLKKPEPYKGKGIRYQDEVIIRKTGKGAKEA